MESKDKCALCEKIFKGCSCKKRKANDGKFVHPKCLNKYNYIIEMEKSKSHIKEEE